MVVLIYAMGVRRATDDPTEHTFLVCPPKLWDGPISLGFDDERSHGRVDSCVNRLGPSSFYSGKYSDESGVWL